MGGENNGFFFFSYCTWDSITILTFSFFLGKKKKTNGYVISEFVWVYFGMPKIEDEIGESAY